MARILFVSHTSDIGGPTNRLLTLLKHLRAQHEAAVVAPDHGALFDRLESMRIPAYAPGGYGLTRKAIPWLSLLILRGRFDLVYGNNYSSGPRNALIAAKLTGRPFTWHINEMLKTDRSRHRRTALFLRYADLLLADSKACAQSVQRHVPTKRVHQVYNGIELGDFQLDVQEAREHVRSILGVPDDHLLIVNAGTVCSRKGQEYSLQAAIQIADEYPNASFAFLGDLDMEPEYAHALKARAGDAGLEDRIRFLGFRRDFHEFMVGSDICLHTAIQDPHPITVLSAMAARLPVVAFAVDGLKEQVVDGETGCLVPFGDEAVLVRALRTCLQDPALRERMGEAGRQRVQTLFSAEEMARRIGELIDEVLCD